MYISLSCVQRSCLQKKESPAPTRRITLDQIKSEEDIENLTTKEIKRVLLNNFVDFKGCCEKWELQDRLKRLWRDNEINKKKGIS